MREIKFRAWYAKTQEMFEVTDMQWSASFAHKISKLEIISLKSPYPIYVTTGDGCESYNLMQYTGLKDSKGQEIFEGDIVRINHPQDLTGDFTNAIGEVFWWDEEGGWYHGNGNGRPPKRMWRYAEVIGNIYEHPQLLEGNNTNASV